MLRPSLASLVLLGCAQPAMPATADRPPILPPSATEELPPLERTVVNPVWTNLADEATLLAVADLGPPDPTMSLAWPAPPSSVGCVVRGTGDPFPKPCEPPLVTVHARGKDVAVMNTSTMELVWGVPRKPSRSTGLWVHGRDGGVSVTGYARAPTTFAMRRDVMVVKDHVWVRKDAPVIARFAGEGVAVSIQDDTAGVQDVQAIVACDDLSFDPLEVAPFAPVATATPPAEAAPEPVIRYAKDSLNLFTEPGGARITTLRSTTDRSITVDLTVVETRDAWSRVRFETTNARFDVWVASAELSDESRGWMSGGSIGCGSSGGFGRSTSTQLGRASALHLGSGTPDARPAAGLQIAADTQVYLGEQKDGFVAVTPVGAAITPPGELQFWVPEAALDAE